MLSAGHALVAQLDRVLDYESRGQGFESLRARQSRLHCCVNGFFVQRIKETGGCFDNRLFVYYRQVLCCLCGCPVACVQLVYRSG